MCLCLVEMPSKKKRRLENKELGLYQIIDLFSLVLDHIPLVGVDIVKLIDKQLYHDIVLPLLTSLPSLVCMVSHYLENP